MNDNRSPKKFTVRHYIDGQEIFCWDESGPVGEPCELSDEAFWILWESIQEIAITKTRELRRQKPAPDNSSAFMNGVSG